MSLNQTKKTNHAHGLQAEALACEYLKKQGYKILSERYKTKFGEIDLVAFKDDILCFVEVKARKGYEEALEAVTYRTQMRIQNAALFYLSQNPEYTEHGLRFDVITVDEPASGQFRVRHLDNAWEARP